MIFAQDSTLTGDLNCDDVVNGLDAEILQNLIFQIQDVNELAEEYPCFNDNVTGLTPEQLQELINMMDEQVNINYNNNGGSSNYPAMISSISSETMNFGNALIYCADLEEDGHSDWFLPNLDQLAYAVSGGCELPDERTSERLWTASKSHSYDSDIVILAESGNYGMESNGGSADYKCRCVRFEEGETSASSSVTTGSSSSIENSSEKDITMIGPMYIYSDFPDFQTFYTATNSPPIASWIKHVYYYEALRFCAQLEYNGYDDWFMPSMIQIENYILNNLDTEIVIPNRDNDNEYFYTRVVEGWNMVENNNVLTIYITNPFHDYPHQAYKSSSSGLSEWNGRCFCVR